MTQSPRQFLQLFCSGQGNHETDQEHSPLRSAGAGLRHAGTGRRQRQATSRLRRGKASAARRSRRTTRPDEKDYKELSGQVVYQVLLAEVALQRGRNEFASQAYADLAVRTRDPGVIERAIEVAGYARRMDVVLELANLWVQVQPDSKRAQQVMVGVLIMSNQLDGLAPRLIRMLEADPAALPANLWRSTGCLPAARIVRRFCS
jgi:hypothetical protein